jgi:TolB-like protein
MPYSPGVRVGPYEIVSEVGAGGMGEVYRARDTKLGRDVAIKVLRPALAQEPEELSRFEQEARSASALNHPNIVTIYDVGRYESAPYIAMEYVEGVTLKDLLSAGPIPMRRLLPFAVQIADGLAKAHSAGILHRDLKPRNIMVTTEGFVKIVDFGLAKLVPRTLEPASESVTPGEFPTRPGVVLGTVAYMSPEQAGGSAADFRSDQFSFGTILYEMATGKHPFRRDTEVQTLVAIIHDDPEPIAKLSPKLPPPFCWIVERCLAKAPEERYASSFDLAKELQHLRDHLGDASRPPAWSGLGPTGNRRRSAARWLMAVTVALSLALGLGFAFDLGDLRTRLLGVPQPATIDSIAVLRLENLSRDPEQDYFADGMTDELIAALAKIESVKVISLKSVMPVRGLDKPLHEFAKELDFDSLLRGSVMKAGDRVRINTELVEASNGRLLWAESYAGNLRDMLTFQNDVAQAMSREIRAQLTPRQRDRLNAGNPVDPEAYEAYLRGRYHWNKRTQAGLKRALEYFEQAVGKDPGYAPHMQESPIHTSCSATTTSP